MVVLVRRVPDHRAPGRHDHRTSCAAELLSTLEHERQMGLLVDKEADARAAFVFDFEHVGFALRRFGDRYPGGLQRRATEEGEAGIASTRYGRGGAEPLRSPLD